MVSQDLRQRWREHMCGVCLAIRDKNGRAARLATNADGILLSVLMEAQTDRILDLNDAGRCLLRRMQPAKVKASGEEAVRFAAAASLLMAGVKLADHIEDADGRAARLPGMRTVARKWMAEGHAECRSLGWDSSEVQRAVIGERAIQGVRGLTFDQYTEPVEQVYGDVFGFSATLADRPWNAPHLREVGRMFGRITVLLDAWRDQAKDLKRGAFNPLVAAVADPDERRTAATRLFDEAHSELVTALDLVDLPKPELVRTLLGSELRHVAESTFAVGSRGESAARGGIHRQSAGVFAAGLFDVECICDRACDDCC